MLASQFYKRHSAETQSKMIIPSDLNRASFDKQSTNPASLPEE